MWQPRPSRLRGEIARFSISTVCDKRELFWRRHVFNFKIREIMRILRRYLAPRDGVKMMD